MANKLVKRGGLFVKSLTPTGKMRLQKKLQAYQWQELQGKTVQEGARLLRAWRTGSPESRKAPRKRRKK